MNPEELQKAIKDCIKENLFVSIKTETNGFMTTDGSQSTRITVSLELDGEIISSDSYST